MKTFIRAAAAVLVSFAVSACGGGGGDEDSSIDQPAAVNKLVIIGNSITRHAPKPEYGWAGDWGMAASSRETDFAHTAARLLNLPVSAHHFADLEQFPTATTPRIPEMAAHVTPTSLVVVELGDNVPFARLAEFRPAYAKLLDSVRHGKQLVCTSTWWRYEANDAVIRQECEARGGRYVYIGDIKHEPGNRDLLEGPQFEHPGVQDHPHDWSMARIAQMVAQGFVATQ